MWFSIILPITQVPNTDIAQIQSRRAVYNDEKVILIEYISTQHRLSLFLKNSNIEMKNKWFSIVIFHYLPINYVPQLGDC